MKILKIQFQNINSLRGTHSIDFTEAPFTTSSLFAITGPTGSGKSTILDVIALALFNQVPRLGKISRSEILNKGAILTRNQQEAFAKVTYESKSGIYTSHWSISTARTGNLREYEMEIIDQFTGAVLDLKKSDVPVKNEELIGLNYNQFIKSVLLAQGEFAQFLKAKKDERGELLEKITGTGVYRQLGRMAFEKFKFVNQEIENQNRTIEIIEKNLLEDEELENFKIDYASKENTCKPLEEEIKSLGKNLELKRSIEQQIKEIDRISVEKKSADLNLHSFIQTNGAKLQQHEKVREFAEELRSWGRLTRDCANLNEDLSEKQERQKANIADLKDCLKEVSGFTRLQIGQDELESQLEKFSEKVRMLTKDLETKIEAYKGFQREFRIETRELPCELNEKDPEGTRHQLEELKIKAEFKIEELTSQLQDVNLNDPETERIRLKKHLNESREANSRAENIIRIKTEIKRITSEEEKLAPVLKELPSEIRHNDDQVTIFKERIEILHLKRKNQLLIASLKDHRVDLKDGEPCPLCGAEHHPYAINLPVKNELEAELKMAETELHQWNHKLAANKNSLEHYSNSLKLLIVQKTQLEQELKLQEKEFSVKYEYLKKDEEINWATLIQSLNNKIENLEQYQKVKRSLDCVHIGLPLVNKMIATGEEGKTLRNQLLAIYSGKDIHSDTRKFQTRWTRLKEMEKAIRDQIKELERKIGSFRKELNCLEEKLTTKVSEKGFKSIVQAGEAVLPDTEYFKLQTGRDRIEKEIAKNVQSLKLLNSQLEISKSSDVKETLDEIIQLQKERSLQFESVQQECQHLKRVILNDTDNREKIKKIRFDISEKKISIRRWDLLNKLIGDSTGKKFNDFAQDLSLSHLLQLANVRLKDLSDRYRIDKPGDDEDDGLVAIDDHMGGQRRSVKTLSGGETFILSLSMALALSDLASRSVEINSLFIDEGFGTLDPETLDQTLDTLEKLQAESSKTIGIISHVDSLKERIATQIQLQRNGQGYSSLVVKG